MRLPPRRLTFQLVSLFDLLIIIVFAQYLDLEQKTGQEVAEIQEQARQAMLKNAGAPTLAELEQSHAALAAEVDQLTRDRDALREEAALRQTELTEEVRQAHDALERLGSLVAELFDVPGDSLEKLLKSRTPDEADRIRKALKSLAANRGSAAVRHVLTLAELEKRCDIWQVHIRDDNSYEFEANDRKSRFRAETAERFETELVKQYKTLPQPKSLVLILLSWGDAELRARRAALAGIESASERMRIDTDRRTRFEYAVLGYIPSRGP